MATQFGPNPTAGAAVIVPTGLIMSGVVSYDNMDAGFNVGALYNCKVVSMPGVAGVWNTVYSAAGKGTLQNLFLSCYDATARTLSMRVTIDDNIIFNIRSAQSTSTNVYSLVGTLQVLVAGTYYSTIPDALSFNKSLLIEFSSGVTDANSARVAYRVIPR